MNKFLSNKIRMTVLAMVSLIALPLASAAPDSAEAQKIAEDAYLYGLQQVIFYGQRWTSTQNDSKDNQVYTGVNRFNSVREKITPDFPIVTPNATTLYGSAFFDLQKEPLVLEMPAIKDRYFSFQLMDQYGIFHTMVGSQFNGTAAHKYLFLPVGYEGKIPRDFVANDVIQAHSNTGYGLVRIAVMTGSDEEIRKINAWQDQITVTPMSEWLANGKKGTPQAKSKVIPGGYKVYPRMAKIAKGQVDNQTAEDFFTILNLAINDPSMSVMSDSLKEHEMLKSLETFGIGKGKDFKWSDLDKETQAALTAGFKAGFKQVRDALKGNLIDLNGWGAVRNSGGFETKWLDRALMADVGWAGPDRNVSHGAAFLFTDDAGESLDGANKYTLTFDMDDLPPVSEFWSIPIYNKDGYFVANAIDRYTINSFMLDAKQLHVADGKLVIYVQKDKPNDAEKLKNWLPAPEGSFRFTARFYGPKMNIIDGSYKMPKPIKTK